LTLPALARILLTAHDVLKTQPVTNYQSIATCACIGENLAVRLPVVLDRVEMPLLSTAEVDLHLGGGSSWDQRRAFEWGLHGGVSRRNGDLDTTSYCDARVTARMVSP
jgi:hypothetical protein